MTVCDRCFLLALEVHICGDDSKIMKSECHKNSVIHWKYMKEKLRHINRNEGGSEEQYLIIS